MDQQTPEQSPQVTSTPATPVIDENQKLIRKITRGAAIAFLVIGALILMIGNNFILGLILMIIGITDIILVPHILATVITAQINRRNDKG